MKLLGAALLLVSAGWLGGSWKRAQTRRLAVLDALDRTLSRLGPELERGMPLRGRRGAAVPGEVIAATLRWVDRTARKKRGAADLRPAAPRGDHPPPATGRW